jgi:hypothetical protein
VGDINALGSRLIEERNLDSAAFVFEKNIELYPCSWNVWDSLGEVLARAVPERLEKGQ